MKIMHYHLQYKTAKDHTVRFYFPITCEGLFPFNAIRTAVTQLDSCIIVILSCFLWNKSGRNAKLNTLRKDTGTLSIHTLYGVVFNCV
jgi:hypothetical protein